MIDIELILLASAFAAVPAGFAIQGYWRYLRCPVEGNIEKAPDLFALYLVAAGIGIFHYALFLFAVFVIAGLDMRKPGYRNYLKCNAWYRYWILLFTVVTAGLEYAAHIGGWNAAALLPVWLLFFAMGKAGEKQHEQQNG